MRQKRPGWSLGLMIAAFFLMWVTATKEPATSVAIVNQGATVVVATEWVVTATPYPTSTPTQQPPTTTPTPTAVSADRDQDQKALNKPSFGQSFLAWLMAPIIALPTIWVLFLIVGLGFGVLTREMGETIQVARFVAGMVTVGIFILWLLIGLFLALRALFS